VIREERGELTRNNSTTDFLRRDFGHVEDDDGGDEANTKTGNQTSSNQQAQRAARSLQDTSNPIHNTPQNNRRPASKPIRQITRHDGTEERPSTQYRNDERLMRRRNHERSNGRCRGVGAWDRDTGEERDEVGHGEHSRNVSRVETEEDTTEGGEHAHGIGSPCRRRLDTTRIRRGGDGSSSTHLEEVEEKEG
jgi:hypothetical protein